MKPIKNKNTWLCNCNYKSPSHYLPNDFLQLCIISLKRKCIDKGTDDSNRRHSDTVLLEGVKCKKCKQRKLKLIHFPHRE